MNRTFVLILFGISIAAPTSGSASQYPSYIRAHYPRTIQPLLLRESELDDQCRGETSEADQRRVCSARDRLVAQIEAKGWCWGSQKADASEADKTWLRCSQDRTDTAGGASFRNADAHLTATYGRLMARYDQGGRSALRDAERGWLARRNRECGTEAVNPCATRMTDQRVTELDDQLRRANRR